MGTRVVVLCAAGGAVSIAASSRGDQVIFGQPPAPSPAVASGSNATWLQDADDFWVSGQETVEAHTLRWWGGYFPGPPPESASFRVRLYSSSGPSAVPQTLLQTIQIPASQIAVAPTEYFSTSFGETTSIFEFTAPVSLTLDPEIRYWLNIARSDAGGFVWYEGVEGNNTHATMNPNPQFFLPWTAGATDRAFELIGVPGPGPAALGLVGVIGVVRRRR